MLQILIPPKDLRRFRRSLLRWYRRHGRDLPWRRTHDPYAILVSEVMLQQTQVTTVIPYYNKWLGRFPDFAALARASQSDVLHAWQGLGYYSRARNLHAAAKMIVRENGATSLRSTEKLRALPGLGRYTANAVATFAFNQSVPIVDANISRLLTRLSDYRHPIDSSRGREAIWRIASTMVPRRGARVFNTALMELGALVCRARPKCDICPVQEFCRAPKPETLPRKKRRPKLKELTESHAWICSRRHVFLQQSNKRWRGLWILPPLSAKSTSTRAIHMSIFPFTNHRITLRVFARPAPKIPAQSQRWIDIDSIASVPIPSPHRRAIEDILSRPRRRN
ncbi:MAG: A/G-specific adenine glycosylase [Verrucomicrobiota bacterium]